MLHHVEINVSNLEEAAKFWGWFLPELGYEAYQSWPSGRSWKMGATYIVFVQTESDQLFPAYDRRKTGLNHLAFHAEDAQQVDIMRAKLIEQGVPILKYTRDMPDDPNHAVIFTGPDGVLIEYLVAKEQQEAPL